MKYILVFILIILTGCQRYGIVARKQTVTPAYLASTHVGSPDPRQADPPNGQMVIMEWWVPMELIPQNPVIRLDMVFWDFTKRRIEFPIDRRVGYETYFVLGDDFLCTKGILTYKVEIVTEDGEVFRDWKHQLWVELIQIDEETKEEEEAASNSSSVSEKSMQGSVIEIPSSNAVKS